MHEYFLDTQGRRIGPLSEDELRGYFRSQLLRPLDMVSGGDLPAPLSAKELAQLWELEFRPSASTPPAVPHTRVLVMQRDDSWPAGVRVALVAVALALAGWWLLAPRADNANATTLPALATASASSPRPTNSSSAAPTAGAAGDAPAAGGGAPSGLPEPKPAPRPSAATGNKTGAWEAQAASIKASAAGTGAGPGVGQVEHHWLETAEQYSADCCWGSLLEHTLEWTRAEPQRALAWSYLGVAQLHNWNFEEAQAAHDKAQQLDPQDFTILIQAGNFRFARTQFVEAAQLYQRATAVDASRAAGWVGLGNAYSQMPDHEKAIDAYRHALQIDGHDATVLRVLGEEYYHVNRFKEAIATYEQAVAIAPEDARLKEDLARAKQR